MQRNSKYWFTDILTKHYYSLLQQDEWEEYFNYYKEECSKLANAITAADSKIDELVYQLYNLTEEEIKIIERL